MQLTAKGFRSSSLDAIEIPENASLVVLAGDNGAGKSTLIRLIRRMLGDDTASPERSRTGEKAEASLTRHGQTITLRLASKFSLTGTAPIRLAAGEGRMLSDLIGPDDDDASKSTTATKSRVRALARLAKLEPTEAILQPLASGIAVSLSGWREPTDFMAVVGELKRRIEEKAREHKSAYDRAEGRATQINRDMSAIPTTTEPTDTIAALTLARDTAQRTVYQAEASAKAREQQEAQRATISTSMPRPGWGDIPNMTKIDTSTPPTIQSVASAILALDNAKAAAQSLRDQVKQYESIQLQLAQPITGCTAADVDAARQSLADAQAALANTTNHARRADLTHQHETAMLEQDTAAALETTTRQAAQAIPGKIADMIRAAQLETLSIDESGEVTVNTTDGWVPMSTMSFGERVYNAISALVDSERLSPDGDELVILTLAPSHYAALGTTSRQVLAMSLERYAGRVVVLTEAPGDNDGIAVTTPE